MKCFFPLGLAIKLNFDILKVAYYYNTTDATMSVGPEQITLAHLPEGFSNAHQGQWS